MACTSTKNIIFDLGRILVGLDRQPCIDAFRKVGCGNVAHYVEEHLVADLFLDAEVGRISTPQFCDEVRRLCRCQTPDADIVWAWNQLLTGIPDAKKQRLVELHRTHRLFILSNTNWMHWDKCAADFFPYRDPDGHWYTVADYFDRVFLSCSLGLAKPSPDIYRAVLDKAGISAADTLFIDDMEENCRAAARLGIHILHDADGTRWLQTVDRR